MSALTVLAAIAVLVFVIGHQVMGSAVRGKRLIVLPAVLTVIGILDMTGHESHAGATDVVNKVEPSEAAKNKASGNLAKGRRRAQIKRSDTVARSEQR